MSRVRLDVSSPAVVLVVEDDPHHAELIERSFASARVSWVVHVAGSLAVARQRIQDAPPDLVVTDLILPDGRGTDLLADEKDEQPFPIVIVTARGDERAAVESLKAGAYDYVVKSASELARIESLASRVIREHQLVRERRAAETALRKSEEQYRSLVEDMPYMIFRCSPDGEITFANSAFGTTIGVRPDEMGKRKLCDLVPEARYQRVIQQIEHLSPEHPVLEDEYELEDPSGEPVWQQWIYRALFDGDGSIDEIQAVGVDVSDRKRREQDLEERATTDSLTGLPNRAKFMDRLEFALSKARRYDHLIAVLYVDLDGFKAVNDTHGHQIGDYLLKGVATRFCTTFREIDTVARIGGDEFAVLIEQPTTAGELTRVIERALGHLGQSYQIDNHEISVSVSIGVSVFPHDGNGADELMVGADRAMYMAKREGRNRYRYASTPI